MSTKKEVINNNKGIFYSTELVRNPYSAFYLNSLQNPDKKDFTEFQFVIDNDDLIPINQDILYNDKVSDANPTYEYSDRIREVTNIRYVRSNSEVIADNYRDNLIEFGADKDEPFLVPFDYILVTRKDGTQFLIVEDFSNTHDASKFHQYSIIRYIGGLKNPFRADAIYSDGIDLARLLSNDQEYIDVFANKFLSEQRLNEALLTTYGSVDAQHVDESIHGGGYVGYIDAKTLEIKGSLQLNEMLLFENRFMKG